MPPTSLHYACLFVNDGLIFLGLASMYKRWPGDIPVFLGDAYVEPFSLSLMIFVSSGSASSRELHFIFMTLGDLFL